MPKRKPTLSAGIRKILAEKNKGGLESKLVTMEASGHLIERLKLPKETEINAKRMVAHSQRILDTQFRIAKKSLISVNAARKIIETVLEELPEFLKRRSDLSAVQLRNAKDMETSLREDLKKLKNVPGDQLTSLSQDFLGTAKDLHLGALEALMGERKYGLFNRAMIRTMRVMANREL